MDHNAATLKYEVSFSASDGRHVFTFRRRKGSAFRKANQVVDSGILVHAGKRFIGWTTTGDRVIRPPDPRRPPDFRARRVFLSYSTRNQTDGQWVHDVLRDTGHEVWYDVYSLAPGDALRPEIERNIRTCEVFVPLLDRDYVSSDWCRLELETAAAAGVRVAPVSVETGRISYPSATEDIFVRMLGEPKTLDLRKSDATNELKRFAYGRGRPG